VIKLLSLEGGQGGQLRVWEVAISLLLCLICTGVISLAYRFTHKGTSYSQSFVHTLILTGMVTTVIMIVIGSNIARAFSLVGALSIIRFRNAVKETRDVGFIFFAMAIAMACGTRFYGIAVLATVVISAVVILMHLSNFGARSSAPERLLRVQLPPGVDAESVLGATLNELFEAYSIVIMESVRQGLYTEVTLSVKPKSGITGAQVLKRISKVNDNLKVTYNYALHTDYL